MGAFIKDARIKARLTQTEVAEAADISRSTLSLIENGTIGTVGNLIKVLRVLDQLHVLQDFVVRHVPSPLDLAKSAEVKYKRVRKSSTSSPPESDW